MLVRRVSLCGVAVMALLVAAGCGSAPEAAPASPTAASPTAAGTTSADADFVRHMLPHHQRAIEVGALAASKGTDPRVREFGRRIVAEQTPEEQRLAGWITQLGLSPQPGDAMAADGYIDDASLARLRGEAPAVFDRDVLLASAASETGAASMARTELSAGTFAPARELAGAISTAPDGEIPQLRGLAAALPPA